MVDSMGIPSIIIVIIMGLGLTWRACLPWVLGLEGRINSGHARLGRSEGWLSRAAWQRGLSYKRQPL